MSLLIVFILITLLIPMDMVAHASSTDPIAQIGELVINLQHKTRASVTCIIDYNGKKYKEVKLYGTARIVYKNGKFQLDDEKKLLYGVTDTNYYFLDMKNNLVANPDTIAKFETIHVANKYLATYKKGDSIEKSFLLWKSKKVYCGADLMDRYYEELDKEKRKLENEGFEDGLKHIGNLYFGEALSAPYQYLFNGETLSFKGMTGGVMKGIGIEAAVGFVLKNFSPYPNYTFRDFLNSTYYTWYNQINAQKAKVKGFFQDDYIRNFDDASLFLSHINTVFMLSGTYPFILEYIGIEVNGGGLYDFTFCKVIDPGAYLCGKDIGIGSYYNGVTAAFGKPKSSSIKAVKSDYSPFSYTMEAKYDFGSLLLGSFDSKDPATFFVVTLIINKKGYNGVFGIQVGDTKEAAIKKINNNKGNSESFYISSDGKSVSVTNEDYLRGYFIRSKQYGTTPIICELTYSKNLVSSMKIFYAE